MDIMAVAPFPGHVDFVGRNDFYMRLSRNDEAAAILELVKNNQYIAKYQHWAKNDTLKQTQKGIRDRFKAIKAKTSIQYRLIDRGETKYDGIVGTLTAFDYDKASKGVKVGYYQAETSQGKGRMITAAIKLIELMRDVWQVRTVEFGIEDSNIASIKLVQKLGAVSTDILAPCNCSSQCPEVLIRTWRLTI